MKKYLFIFLGSLIFIVSFWIFDSYRKTKIEQDILKNEISEMIKYEEIHNTYKDSISKIVEKKNQLKINYRIPNFQQEKPQKKMVPN